MNIIEKLKGGLIVSCQALPGNPLKGALFMSAMALAAEKGGAVGIRANGKEDIAAIREKVTVPIIGINKLPPSDGVYITPNFAMAEIVAEAGSDIIAIDATPRPRPGGESLGYLIEMIKSKLSIPVMADISTFEEGVTAADLGAEIVATTLSGHTSYSLKQDGPDLKLLEKLTNQLDVPVIAEGRFLTSGDIEDAFNAGAFAVVIGKAITNPMFITKKFTEKLNERN